MASSSSFLFHPFAVVSIIYEIAVLTAAFTPSGSSLRPAILALLAAYTWACLSWYSSLTNPSHRFGGTAGIVCALWPLVFIDRLLLRQWAFEDRHYIFPAEFARKKLQDDNDEYKEDDSNHVDKAHVTAKVSKDTLRSRYAFGEEVVTSGRMVCTPWEAKNVPPFSASDAKYVPSRVSIIARETRNLIASILFREVTMEVQMSVDPVCYAQSRVPFLTRLDEVTHGEVLVRSMVAILSWIYLYWALQMIFSVRTILLAIVKPGEMRKLRPLFGSLVDAYTLRGFWG